MKFSIKKGANPNSLTVGPNRSTTGVPKDSAKCNGAESPVINKRAFASIPAVSV